MSAKFSGEKFLKIAARSIAWLPFSIFPQTSLKLSRSLANSHWVNLTRTWFQLTPPIPDTAQIFSACSTPNWNHAWVTPSPSNSKNASTEFYRRYGMIPFNHLDNGDSEMKFTSLPDIIIVIIIFFCFTFPLFITFFFRFKSVKSVEMKCWHVCFHKDKTKCWEEFTLTN